METFPFDSWALQWAVHARNVSHGDVVAGLLLELAADPRGVYLAPSVVFPLAPAARALEVPAVLVRTALHQLGEAGLVRLGTDDRPPGRAAGAGDPAAALPGGHRRRRPPFAVACRWARSGRRRMSPGEVHQPESPLRSVPAPWKHHVC
ncbi:hypothetical protein ACFWWM_38515 [Streptomyces sp. NPDC058682]|uniref:hypothetical protein n=1 Tax=Streptomyces sp. NPDC058682 TaxID=3346596 RepID=UPI003659CC3F